MKTQCERIVEYMEEHGSITTKDAFFDLGISRLSARIFELRDAGYAIAEEWESAENRYGEMVNYKRFKLKEQE